MFDKIIKGGTVYSGKNEAPQQVDIAITGDKIAKIEANLDPTLAKEVIDVTGKVITPGFIDPHASTGFGYFYPNAADHKLYQGITTEIFGNCGTSPAPIGKHLEPTMERLAKDLDFPFNWSSLDSYFDKIDDKLQFNIATLIGHSTLRSGYLSDWHNVSEADLNEMKSATAQAMDEGALGISTGLIYSPGCFAKTDEIVALTKVAAEKGGIYASHIRNERENIEEAVDEALHIGESANCRVLVSHLKSAEQQNWGKIPGIIDKIEAYNQTHDEKAWVDVYPYTAVSTKLRAFIPKDFLADGLDAIQGKLKEENAVQSIKDWVEMKGYVLDGMLIISNANNEQYVNKTVTELAKELNQSIAETIVDVLLSDSDTWVVYHCISEEDMDYAIMWSNAMICTDSWSYPINAPKVIGNPHPRSYGAFTTYLERYVLSNKLSIQEGIYKVTHLPASVFKLDRRGLLQEGNFADIVAFDWSNVKANATYLDPKQLSEGVEHLWVNGNQVIKDTKIQAVTPGKVLNLKKD